MQANKKTSRASTKPREAKTTSSVAGVQAVPRLADDSTMSIPQKPESRYIRVQEVMDILECGETTAYKAISTLNKRLEADGYFVMHGKTLRRLFYEFIGGDVSYDWKDYKPEPARGRRADKKG